jgi:hypothetical protein
MFFDFGNMVLEGPAQRDTMRPEDQLVQVLALFGLDLQASVHIVRHKHIVEHRYIGDPLRPRSVLKHDRRPAAGRCHYDVRRVCRREALPFDDRDRVAGTQRPQHGCERRLATPVFGINQG